MLGIRDSLYYSVYICVYLKFLLKKLKNIYRGREGKEKKLAIGHRDEINIKRTYDLVQEIRYVHK